MEFLNQVWVAVEPAVISALVAVILALTSAGTAWLIQKARLINEQIKAANPTTYALLKVYATDAIKVSEQLNLAGLLELKDRKEKAISYVQSWVDSKGLKVDIAQIEAAIELAIYDEMTSQKVIPVTTTTTTSSADVSVPDVTTTVTTNPVVTVTTTPDTKEVG
jgi:hypothetical protein